MNFAIVTKAGLSQGELAKLLDVSLLTAHSYMTKKSNPHRIVAARVEKTLGIIAELVERQKLPLAYAPRGEDRPRRLRAIQKLKEYVDARLLG